MILPHVEDGDVCAHRGHHRKPVLRGSLPTSVPLPRVHLTPLIDEQVETIVRRAIVDPEHGLGELRPDPGRRCDADTGNAVQRDARVALNALELAASAASADGAGVRSISSDTLRTQCSRGAPLRQGRGPALRHYICLHKVYARLDPDAAIYWLARMIESSEDPLFIARRLVILAAEDVGMADPQALSVAVAAQQAVTLSACRRTDPSGGGHRISGDGPKEQRVLRGYRPGPGGCPEDAQRAGTFAPTQRGDGVDAGAGLRRDYKYSHDYEGHFSPMENLPPGLRGRRYYRPGDQGYEQQVADRLRGWWGIREEQGETPSNEADEKPNG